MLQAPCSLCIGSAVISLAMFVFAWQSELFDEPNEGFVVSACTSAVTVAAAALVYFVGGVGADPIPEVDTSGLPK